MLALEARGQAALPSWRALHPFLGLSGFPLIKTQLVGNASVPELCMRPTHTPEQGPLGAVLTRRKGENQWLRPGQRGPQHEKPSLCQRFSVCFPWFVHFLIHHTFCEHIPCCRPHATPEDPCFLEMDGGLHIVLPAMPPGFCVPCGCIPFGSCGSWYFLSPGFLFSPFNLLLLL